jgi:hypothetical protein
MRPTLSQIVDLRLSVLEQHDFFGCRKLAKKAIIEDHRTILESGLKSGIVEALYDGGKLRAALIISGKAPLLWGKRRQQVKVLLRGGDRKALLWMKLSRVMGRPIVAYSMKTGKAFFNESYFRY